MRIPKPHFFCATLAFIALLCGACTYERDALRLDSPKALTIVDITPSPGAIDVPVDTAIRLTFNVPLSGPTVDDSDLTVLSGLLQAPGSVKADLLDRTLEFQPSGLLRRQLRFALVVSSDLEGLNGATLKKPFITEFTTGSRRDRTTRPEPQRIGAGDLQPIWAAHCVRCHNAARPRSGVDLSSPAAATASLRNIPSNGTPSLERVSPRDHTSSYLMYQLIGEFGFRGYRMPPQGNPLESDDLRRVADWIDNGAVE